MNSKLWNQLVIHLNIVICIYVQNFFTKHTFLLQVVIIDWNDEDKVRVLINA